MMTISKWFVFVSFVSHTHNTDSAMSALSIMVDNHFRHLPVLNDLGAIVGLLDSELLFAFRFKG